MQNRESCKDCKYLNPVTCGCDHPQAAQCISACLWWPKDDWRQPQKTLSRWDRQKNAVLRVFREVLETPHMVELEFNYHAEIDNTKYVSYRIKRAVIPADEDDKA